jgi:Bacterial membrane protein YfhO
MGTASAPSRRPSWTRDALGVAWVLAAAIGLFIPALVHGASFGPFDVLSRYGLTANPKMPVHNLVTTDQIDELIPWATLAWTQVHHGQLPLWNPYTALGMPLAFNWQAAPFGVPALIGYLAPLRLEYTVQVVVTVAIAGTGMYLLCRVLRMGVVAAAFGATLFELSGPMIGWLGWPVTSVVAWAGWLLAASLLVIGGKRRGRSIAFFAVVLAAAVYAGQPNTLAVLMPVLVVFWVVLLGLRAPRLRGTGPILRPAIDLVVAIAAGLGLSAPLALPGLQLTSDAVRIGSKYFAALPLHDLVHLVFQTFDSSASVGFSSITTNYYPESVAYVGVIALVLVVVGTVTAWRRREVIAFGAVVIVSALLVFVSPLVSALAKSADLPIDWHRGLMTMAVGLSVLAAFGMESLIRLRNRVPVLVAGGFLCVALWLLYIWFEGRGHLAPPLSTIRAHSFVWPAIDTALGLVVAGALVLATRRHGARSAPHRPRPAIGLWAGVALLIGETAFLVAVGGPPLPSSPTFFSPTPQVRALQSEVGTSLVGFGTGSCANVVVPQVGILQEANDAYGVDELAAYDPLLSRQYTRSWPGSLLFSSLFCPKVSTLAEARLYGVSFVLEPVHSAAPAGGVFDTQIGNEALYRMPGAASATLTPSPLAGPLPPAAAPGRPVAVEHASPSTWRIDTVAPTSQVLRLRLTAVPGWHATIDGRPLALLPFHDVMLQARIPAGRHTVELSYWPSTFTIGIVVAICTALGLVLVPLSARTLRRRRRHDGSDDGAAGVAA